MTARLSSFLFAAILLSTVAAHAQTLHEFEAPAQPASSLVDGGDGFFYGTSVTGGTAGKGEIYKVNLTTGERTTIASFDGSNGANPYGDVLVYGQYLYGTTSAGPGPLGLGTVYKFDRSTGTLTTVHALTEGFHPLAGLVAFGSYLYGTTSEGGSTNQGTIFKVDLASGAVTSVVNFGGTIGSNPFSPLVASGSFLYGTTLSEANGNGTVFKFDPNTGALTTLTTQSTVHGFIFQGLLAAGSVLYGVSSLSQFSSFGGSVFQVDPATGAVTTVVDFTDLTTGVNGPVGLCFDGTFLYGLTYAGGDITGGTIFKLDPKSGAVSKLHSFSLTDGFRPLAAPIIRNGILYGTTQGGPNYGGTIFQFDLSTNALKTLAFFNDSGEGAVPSSRLMRNGGFLYGTSYAGGLVGIGTVYRLDPSSGAVDLVAPMTGLTGGHSIAGLTAASGKLYGTTPTAGAKNNGTIFGVDPSTADLAAVITFDPSKPDGAFPQGGLILVGSNLYGTTSGGGTNGNGTIFRLDPSTGTLTTLYKFNPLTGNLGGAPRGALLSRGSFLYGTTSQLSSTDFSYGIIFRIDPTNGSFTNLGTTGRFTPGAFSSFTWSGLTALGSYLYGTSRRGGPSGFGTIYRVDPDNGGVTTIYSFDGTHGNDPGAGDLVTDGTLLFGTTMAGGAYGHGTVFQFDPVKGTLTTIKSFALTDGDSPTGGLLIDGGFLYGVTQYGGSKGGGTLFRVPIPKPRRRVASPTP